MASADIGRTCPTHNMNPRVGNSTIHNDHCEPTQSAMAMPISTMRFQFQKTTSRGA